MQYYSFGAKKKEEAKILFREDVILIFWPLYIMLAIYADFSSNFEYVVLTYLVIGLTMSIFVCLVGNVKIGCFINLAFHLILYVTNDTVLQFRKSNFLPIDLLNVRTALSVSESYLKTWRLTYGVIAAMITSAVLGYMLWESWSEKTTKNGRIKSRIIAMIMGSIFLIFAEVYSPTDWIPGQYYTNKKVDEHGYVAVFFMELKNLYIKQPENYSVEKVEAIIEEDSIKEIERNVDIIVILDEAFSDLLNIGEVKSECDYMPFIRELMTEYQSGKVYVPSWGGNTCNTEWELLTGNSMIFCNGTIPYSQYITSERFSIAAHLEEHDYQTSAIHPYYSTGYRRNQVYPYLGFDEYIFAEDMDSRYKDLKFDTRIEKSGDLLDNMYLRNLISDKSSFEQLIEIYEKNLESDKNQFIFNLTMQNHGPFTYENFDATVETDLSETHPDKDYVEQYLSLIKETDSAFKSLIEYFTKVERDTIILFVGDHQPGIGTAFYNEMWGYEWGYTQWSQEETLSRYEIPYVMWTNFECELKYDYSNVSGNYLSLLLMDAAELDSNGWYTFLNDVYKEYPVINSMGIMDSKGEWHFDVEEMLQKDETLKKYWEVQYYRMFDE